MMICSTLPNKFTWSCESLTLVILLTDEVTLPSESTLANVDSEGKVTSSVNNITNVKLSQDQVNLLGNVEHIIIDGVINTTDYQNSTVKFYDSYGISLKLGFILEVKN